MTLVAGTATAAGLSLTTGSKVVYAIKDQGGVLTDYASMDVTLNVGAGTITFAAKNDADVALGAATPIVDFIVVS